MVLSVMLENDSDEVKIGVIATKSVGGAVSRNHTKRLLRAAIDPFIERIKPGMKLVLIGRKPIVDAETETISKAIQTLLTKADLLMNGQ